MHDGAAFRKPESSSARWLRGFPRVHNTASACLGAVAANPRTGTAAIWLCVLIVAVAGCGGGGSVDQDSGANPPPPVPQNQAPVAIVDGPSRLPVGELTRFVGNRSSDPEGDTLSFAFSLERPAGSNATLQEAGTDRVTMTPDIAGTYRVRLVVSDGQAESPPAFREMEAFVPPPPPPIEARIEFPLQNRLVPDVLEVVVTVESIFEIAEVTATIVDDTARLVFDPEGYCILNFCYPAQVGTLSLATQPPGEYTLQVRLTDTQGNVLELSRPVVHDNPPTFTIASPLDETLGLPLIQVDASCTDDLPDCRVELYRDGRVERSAIGQLVATVDFSEAPQPVRATIRVVDSGGQLAGRQLVLYAEDPARLSLVEETPGPILDADASRLLYVVRGDAGDQLSILDRVSRAIEIVALPEARTVDDEVFLTPTGVAFVARDTAGTSTTRRLYLWRDGVLSEVQGDPGSLMVTGPWMIYRDGADLYRRDTRTGSLTLVSRSVRDSADVTFDGTVVYQNNDGQIERYRDGVTELLTNDPTQVHVWPRADLDKAVFRVQDDVCCDRQQYAIVLIDGTTTERLTARRTSKAPFPDRDYQTAADWVAFTELGQVGQLHVFLRDPVGGVTILTDFGSDSAIDHLAGNGEVMLINSRQRYLSSGDRVTRVSSSQGRSVRLDDAWYLAIGRGFVRVDTTP